MDSRSDPHEIGKVTRKKGGKASWAELRWHALGAKPFPPTRSDFEGEPAEVFRELVLPGSAPATPLLSADDEVIALGSCFARELRDHLLRADIGSRSVWVPDGLNNTFALVDFISWCVTGSQTGRGFSYRRTEDGQIMKWKPPTTPRDQYLDAFGSAGCFVFTLGLSEVWEDKETGAVFWQGVPENVFDEGRHVFRLSTVAENERNILQIVELVRSVNEQAPIVLTLSPIPLKATFREVSCVVADCVSKSVLRVAIDQVTARNLDCVYYWPSFEMVRWVGAHRSEAAFGSDKERSAERSASRSVTPEIVDAIVQAFIDAFYVTDPVVSARQAGGRPRPAPASSPR